MTQIQFDPKSPVIVIDVELHGKTITHCNCKMALDTGATYLLVPWKIASKLGLKPELAKKESPIHTASGVLYAPLLTIPKVKALGLAAKNILSIIHDLPAGSRVDGLLGLSFLKHFKLEIDFKKGVLRIE